MDSSEIQQSNGCKTILFRKLAYGVVCSVLAQIFIIFTFIVITSYDIFHPWSWLRNIFGVLASFSLWLSFIPFISIIIAQTIICAKEYIVKPRYNLSRFQKFIWFLSFHNLGLSLSYMIVGYFTAWLYLSISDGKYKSLYQDCHSSDNGRLVSKCLVEDHLFISLSGLWVGIYYFVRHCASERHIQFPIIQQYKLVQFKANFIPLLQESRKLTTWPVIIYFCLYFFWGTKISKLVSETYGIIHETSGISLASYIYVWLLMVLYFFSMNLMSLFFKIFLTEAIEFPIVRTTETPRTLSDIIETSDLPILQHLACLDLYLLSIWSSERRGLYFTLSQPGGHPHNWNNLMQSSLKVLNQFTKTLNESVSHILEHSVKQESQEEIAQEKEPLNPFNTSLNSLQASYMHTSFTSPIQSPSRKYENIRNMSLIQNEPPDLVEVTYGRPKFALTNSAIFQKLRERLEFFLTKLKSLLKMNYFFGEIPEVNIHVCLRNGQPIVWLMQALSHLSVASFTEDHYGIVQKDLHIIITTLIELKQSVDKLNKVAALSRRGPAFKEYSTKMKHSINAAVKRSLYNICFKFNEYLNDLPLSKEVRQQLQYYKKPESS